MVVYKSGANPSAKRVVIPFRCDTFNVDRIRDSLKSMILCSELMQECSFELSEKHCSVKRIGENRSRWA